MKDFPSSGDSKRWELVRGDCLEVLKTFANNSIQCCVTSPPYWGLRDYGVEGQIGNERTPEEYVTKLVEVFREVRRVLRPDGVLWLNLGDSYAGNGKGFRPGSGRADGIVDKRGQRNRNGNPCPQGLKPKDLCGIPWAVAFALRADGWYLRSDVIWHKSNPLPEPVTDRPTRAHEYIFLLTKSERYFYDAEAVKEPSVMRPQRRGVKRSEHPKGDIGRGLHVRPEGGTAYGNRNRRDVWLVATKAFSEAHFATFPPDLIEPCILAGTSEHGGCSVCEAPFKRIVERAAPPPVTESELDRYGTGKAGIHRKIGQAYQDWLNANPPKTVGWQPTCSCGGIPSPQIVLDPFSGAGTTGLVALKHGRKYVGIELNPEYITMTVKRFDENV